MIETELDGKRVRIINKEDGYRGYEGTVIGGEESISDLHYIIFVNDRITLQRSRRYIKVVED